MLKLSHPPFWDSWLQAVSARWTQIRRHQLIAWKQQARYGKTSHVEFANPDLVRVSEAFRCQGIRVGSAAELRPALERAFEETTRSSVVVVAVDYTENMKLTQRLGEVISH